MVMILPALITFTAFMAAHAQTCTVNWNNVHQRIDGFGASSAWQTTWTTTEANLFFSTNNGILYTDRLGTTTIDNGIGLSLLRNHINYANSTASTVALGTGETTIMKDAQTLGAKVWSTPWTPAAGFKSTNDIYDAKHATGGGINGGSYLGSGNNATNLAYASQLANYVRIMKTLFSINIYAISIQNEPDAGVTNYEACQWTGSQIHDFATNLYNALLAQNLTSTMIMLPESQNWQDPHGLAATAMSDPNVAADVGIVADHNYDGVNGPATLTKNSYGKALWETEVAILSGSDSSIANGIYYAQRIHLFMTVAQANAYHYWWLMASSTANGNSGLLDNNGSITKRLFAFGQFSRFVRPGYYRIDAANTGSAALISAYKDTNSGNFAIVAINPNSTVVTQTFNLTNFTAGSVTPWITSSNLSLASQPAVSVANASFTYALPALSVVTFAGQGYVASTNITISNVAYDPGTPAFILTWNSTAGATYSVFRTNVLDGFASPWPVIATGYPAGGASGGPLSYTDTTASVSPAFYQVSSP